MTRKKTQVKALSFDLKITNHRAGLSKIVNADNYTTKDVTKTFVAYIGAGYEVKILRGARV